MTKHLLILYTIQYMMIGFHLSYYFKMKSGFINLYTMTMLRFSSNHSFIQGMYQKRPHIFVTPCPLNITCNVSHRKAVYILKKKYRQYQCNFTIYALYSWMQLLIK